MDLYIKNAITVVGFSMSMGYFPQLWRILKNKSGEDISIPTFAIMALGTLSWTLYGFYLKDTAIIISFIFGVVGSWGVLISTIIYRRRTKIAKMN
jgi:uncharacterized protein with PQ loop repeat